MAEAVRSALLGRERGGRGLAMARAEGRQRRKGGARQYRQRPRLAEVGGTKIFILKNVHDQNSSWSFPAAPGRGSAKYAVSQGKPSRVPKMAVVQDKERLRSVLRKIFSGKTPVGNCLLAEGAKPERVETAPAAGARLQTDAGRS